ncbi:hypothetical protein HDU67_008176 [Dinochytrium kinnereticum]|nr:hypothetical protein HDU67_008176 [Dinochytrium kinnereticum]
MSGAGLYSLRKKNGVSLYTKPTTPNTESPPILPPQTQSILYAISDLGAKRYFQATGFEFCTALNNATFDSLAVINEWGDVTIAKRNPFMHEFTEYIDRHARRIMLLLYGRNQFLEAQELSRFACYAAADGANSVANLSDTRILSVVDPINYMAPILPLIRPSISRIPAPRRKYKLAYLIMAHGDETVLNNLRTLIESLDDGSAIFLIHLDPDAELLHQHLMGYIQEREKSLNVLNFRDNPVRQPGNIFLSSYRYSGLYGHAGQVWMQLSGFFELVDLAEWERVINLSAFDAPLRKSREVARVLARPENRGNEFIAHWGDFLKTATDLQI